MSLASSKTTCYQAGYLRTQGWEVKFRGQDLGAGHARVSSLSWNREGKGTSVPVTPTPPPLAPSASAPRHPPFLQLLSDL